MVSVSDKGVTPATGLAPFPHQGRLRGSGKPKAVRPRPGDIAGFDAARKATLPGADAVE